MTNEEEFREWLEGQPQEVRVAIAYRAAMRVLPLAMQDADSNEWFPRLALSCLRKLSISSAQIHAASQRLSRMDAEVSMAIRNICGEATHYMDSPVSNARKVARKFPEGLTKEQREASLSSKIEQILEQFSGLNSMVDNATFVSGVFLEGTLPLTSAGKAVPVPEILRNAFDDTQLSLFALRTTDIKLSKALAGLVAVAADKSTHPWQRGGPWTFWAKWYARAMAGDPLPWDLQEQIALIPDKVWEAGPEAVAEEIARIEAEFELRERIAELEAAQVVSEEARFGIGGNAPPEEIDDPQVAEQVIIIWDAVAGLKEEVEADEPDAGRVAKLIEQLGAALKAVLAWCGRKGDLAVDVAIKYVIPAGATGYFILMPAKAEAVLKAAQTWLPFLAP